MGLITIASIAGIILVALIILGLILTRLYRRASKEVSFVRTGFRRRKSDYERRRDGVACIA